MDEQHARQKIRLAYSRLNRHQVSAYDDLENNDQVVAYHLNAIRTAGGGQWNNMVAYDYVTNLESQLEEEIVSNDHGDDGGDMGDQRFDRSM